MGRSVLSLVKAMWIRIKYVRAVFRWWWGLTLVPVAALGIYDLAQGQEVVPDSWPKVADIFGVSNISLEIWVIAGLVAVIVASWEGGYRLWNQGQRSEPPGQPSGDSVPEQIRHFIDEGQELRARAVVQGIDPPQAQFDHWRIQVRHFIGDNFEGQYYTDWQNSVHEDARPQQGFTGMATRGQIQLWNRIVSGIEWLQGLERQI